MASIFDWSSTAGSNTTIDGINIAEGCPAANVNNVIRSIAAISRQTFSGGLQSFLAGSSALPVANGGTGATSLTSGYLPKGAGTSAYTASLVYDSGSAVGVGTATPGRLLEVSASAGAIPARIGNNLGSFDIGGSDGNVVRIDSRTWAFGLQTGGVERVRIDTSGNVGVGTSSPQGKSEIRDISSGLTSNSLVLSNYVGAAAINTAVALHFDPNGAGSLARTASIRSRQEIAGNYANLEFLVCNSGTPAEAMRIDRAGNVGIGTASPSARFQATAGAIKNAPTLGSVTNVPGYFTNNDPTYGLAVGVNASDGHTWLQGQRADATGTAYNITLNEAGGNVGIGTASPSQKLDVTGNIAASGAVTSATLTTSGNGSIGGTFGVTGAATLSSTLAVTGATTLSGTSTHTGAATFNGGITANTSVIDIGSGQIYKQAGGNVGIGTSSPGQKLTVAGTIESTTGGYKFPDATTQTTAAVNPVKAWANFYWNGSAVVINGSSNVTSITRSSTGQYTVNFTNALGSGNYAVSANYNVTAGGTTQNDGQASAHSQGSTSFGLTVVDGAATVRDPANCSIIVVSF